MMFSTLEVVDERGRTITMEENMISTPLVGQPKTLAELGDDVADRFHWQDPETGETYRRGETNSRLDHQVEFLRDIQSVMLGSLLYLCNTTLDAEQVPRKFVAKMRPGVARKPISLVKVGWTTGTALSKYRRMVQTGQTPNLNRAGREQEPTQRCAHHKIVWTGKGRTIPKSVFVLPYWTHREKLGEFGINTARKVL